MPSKFAPARRSPGPPRARQTARRAGAAVLTCALTAAVAAGCTTFPQPPGGGGATSGSPASGTPGTPATAGPIPAPTHARDDITHTLPNPNAPASPPADAQHPHAVAAPRIATQFIYRADLPPERSWVAWGQTPLTSWDSDVQPAVRFLRDTTRFGATTYPGHDPSMGRAVDIRPTSAANGTRLANWLMANTGPLGIQYIVWSAQIYNTARASDGVRYLADRGSVTQNHQNHVHVSFRTPGPISLKTAAVRPWTTTTTDYRKTVFSGCPDIRRGSTGACARDWQHFLNLWFGTRYTKLVEDGNFGSVTEGRQRSWEAAARAFPWSYTDVVANLVVQRPEYTRARNHLLFFGIRW